MPIAPMSRPAATQRSKARADLRAPGLPGEAPVDRSDVPPAIPRAFGMAAFAMNRFIVDQTLRCQPSASDASPRAGGGPAAFRRGAQPSGQRWISIVECTISSCTASHSRTMAGVSRSSCVTSVSAQA